MSWLIVGLLVVIVILLGVIARTLEKGLAWIAELIRASGQAQIRNLNGIGQKLDDIAYRDDQPLSADEIFGPLMRPTKADADADADD